MRGAIAVAILVALGLGLGSLGAARRTRLPGLGSASVLAVLGFTGVFTGFRASLTWERAAAVPVDERPPILQAGFHDVLIDLGLGAGGAVLVFGLFAAALYRAREHGGRLGWGLTVGAAVLCGLPLVNVVLDAWDVGALAWGVWTNADLPLPNSSAIAADHFELIGAGGLAVLASGVVAVASVIAGVVLRGRELREDPVEDPVED